ncbi:hypothetical protein R1sor_010525 [Riccia sorocarpa]|uniref:Uncharacterized protein n=1 Tax=Riccia sorocarpa TaxID=122646 RepID=A0ABD3I1P8_9MARC
MTLSGSTNAEVYLTIGDKQCWLEPGEIQGIKAQLRKNKVTTLGGWADWMATEQNSRPLNWAEAAMIRTGETIFPASQHIQDLPWNWKARKRRKDWRSLSTKECKGLLAPRRHDRLPLNKKWNRADTKRQWNRRMQRVWKSRLPMKEKLWLWRLLQHGMPTLDRIQKFGHGDGICLPPARSLIEAVDIAFRGQNLGKILLFVLILKAIWNERNSATYAQQRTSWLCSSSSADPKPFLPPQSW